MAKTLEESDNTQLPKYPQGEESSLILYTTSIKAIRKTHEACRTIKFLLDTLQVPYKERDVSIHRAYKEELWTVMGGCRIIPPRLFINGRDLGGADEVVAMHEQGKLKVLVQQIAACSSSSSIKGVKCGACGGVCFMVCPHCNGSCKVFDGKSKSKSKFDRCMKCNENGLIICPFCF